MIDIQTEDPNNDGRAEEIIVNIGLQGVAPSDVKSVVIIQSINYGISVSHSVKQSVSTHTPFYLKN